MIDYISVIKYMHKGSPFLGHCNQYAAYANGWLCYYIEGCEKLKVLWNPDTFQLRIQGSLMYYWQGHNFTCSMPDFVQAVEYLQEVLQVGLWDSEVEAFEFGVIVEVGQKPKLFIQNHHARAGTGLTENEKGKDQGCFRWWEGGAEKIKMYDARKNIMQKQGLKRRELIAAAGWNPDSQYLKFEIHFLKPRLLNAGKVLLLEDLTSTANYRFYKKILLDQYKLLQPMKTLTMPTDKKDLTSADIVLLAYVEGFINAEGCTPAEAQKALYRRVNLIPEEILSKSDKDSRKRQIKALFAKVKESPESQWDLTAVISKALAKDWTGC